jgi:hypothetical protein
LADGAAARRHRRHRRHRRPVLYSTVLMPYLYGYYVSTRTCFGTYSRNGFDMFCFLRNHSLLLLSSADRVVTS